MISKVVLYGYCYYLDQSFWTCRCFITSVFPCIYQQMNIQIKCMRLCIISIGIMFDTSICVTPHTIVENVVLILTWHTSSSSKVLLTSTDIDVTFAAGVIFCSEPSPLL